ncbi:S1C family serine protease [Subtercola frigoramans]|uniref:Serine protease PepD n=1 Tax=Subtercola frigoramans TaxID=120298 RepID=A0ABS2L185_9MICO|nr:trypsin-like peptidase domain-containing protein [Subtercola frigoramans]MBM7470843.1 putative serine protease PepD [Subtercola frigoramans]
MTISEPAAPTEPPAPDVEAGARAGAKWWQSRRVWVTVAGGAVIALVAGLAGGFIATNARSASVCDARAVANDVLPSIVTISIQGASGGGVGTGEILTSDGYIVTNNHVISDAAQGGTITVLYNSGEADTAALVGRDPVSDLAVLKVTRDQKLPTISIGDSSSVAVGQPVVALGAPLGLSSTVTAGIVSALGRNVTVPSDGDTTTTLAGAIQTDAAINPGNSGGALVSCDGSLVGINTAIASVPNAVGQAGGGSVGIGFAVPVNLANGIVKQLIATGTAVYPWFGVEVSLIPPAVAQRFGVESGLFVESVVRGGPVATAGLQVGDIITRIDGQPAINSDVITRVTLAKQIGDVVDVTYVRDGTEAQTQVTLGAPPTAG